MQLWMQLFYKPYVLASNRSTHKNDELPIRFYVC